VGNYLSDFKENPTSTDIVCMLPSNICPFLFYNLTPYIYTLAKGGWFNWVKRSNKISYRKPISRDDFHKKGVNRLYTNEVLVRCPNPYKSVIAGVGLWPENKIKIRVLYAEEHCPNNHKQGDEIFVDAGDAEHKIIQYNNLFPEVLSMAITGHPYGYHISSCREDRFIIGTYRIIFPCRYHKKTRQFRGSLLPDEFCPHVFALIYPQILAMMYNADIERKIRIKHQMSDSDITLLLEKNKFFNNPVIKIILYLSKKIFETFFYPVDLLDYRLVINVLENNTDNCPLHKGEKYTVNLRDENFLCPASFHVLYPYILLFSAGYKVKWDTSMENDLLPCPDCIGTIYSLEKQP